MTTWRTASIGELSTLIRGTTKTKYVTPGVYPLWSTAREPATSDAFQLEGEAICVPMTSAGINGHARVNRVHYAAGKFAVATSVTALSVRNTGKVSTRFLALLLDELSADLLAPKMRGTTVTMLYPRELESVMVRIPRLSHQQEILRLAITADNAVTAAQRLVEAAEGVLQALGSEMLKSSENGAQRPLGEGSTVAAGLTTNSNRTSNPDNVEVPILRTANLRRGHIEIEDALDTVRISARVIDRLKLEQDDVLVTLTGTPGQLGRASVWPGSTQSTIHQGHLARIRLVGTENTHAPFISQVVNACSSWFDQHATPATGNRTYMRPRDIERLPIPILPLGDQERWARLLTAAHASTEAARKRQAAVVEVRRVVLREALIGGDVSEASTFSVPASVGVHS